MWFGSIWRMNDAVSATHLPMSVPGVTSGPVLSGFGLLFLPGGQLPSRTTLSRFGLSRAQRQTLVGALLSQVLHVCREWAVWGRRRMYGETACHAATTPCCAGVVRAHVWRLQADEQAGNVHAKGNFCTVPHRVWGLAASSTAMIVGSSLYSTPVMVLLRVRSI